MVTIVACGFLFMLGLFTGTMARVWMFINSMYLAIYTVELSIPMPSHAYHFMRKFLKALRLDTSYEEKMFSVDDQNVGEMRDIARHGFEFFSHLLRRLGYEPYFWTNVAPFVYFACAIVFVWLVIVILRVVLRKWF